MPAPSFAHVHEEGFQSFSHELSKNEWALIDTKTYEGPNLAALKSLCDAPVQIGWKLRLTWALAALLEARGGADGSKGADRNWDGTQKRLAALLSAATNDPDPQKRAAAARLQKILLLGAGEGQTKLKYQQEVDFGRTQVVIARESANAADIASLGLDGVIADIEKTTSALAEAIGHGQGGGRRPSERLRAALAACSATFATVEDSMAWVLEHGLPADRTRAQALLTTLHALAKRYPAPTAVEKPEAAPTGAP